MNLIKESNRYVHVHGAEYKGKILMVASSPAVSEQTGWSIGFWAAELTHPLHVFQEAGYEEEFADQAVGQKIQPYRIEAEAKKLAGMTFKVAAPFTSYAIQDGNLITGQQQNSGAAAARMVVDLLEQE